MTYDASLRLRNGSVAWSFVEFERQAFQLLEFSLRHSLLKVPTRAEYLRVQQQLIEHDIEHCRFVFSNAHPAPYFDITYTERGCKAVRAKAVLFNDGLVGCLWRTADRTEERFNFRRAAELAEFLKSEVRAPSFNFCTVFGDDFS